MLIFVGGRGMLNNDNKFVGSFALTKRFELFFNCWIEVPFHISDIVSKLSFTSSNIEVKEKRKRIRQHFKN